MNFRELRFSEVRGSKLPRSGGAFTHRGEAVRGFWYQLAPRLTHSLRGIVASGCDLIRRTSRRILQKEALLGVLGSSRIHPCGSMMVTGT
jgi:hypothetical protein